MKAIQTRYLAPTNTRGARVRAWDAVDVQNSITLPWNYSKDTDDNHDFAVFKLCEKMAWKGKLARGSLANDGNVYVWVEPQSTLIVEPWVTETLRKA